MSIVIDIFTNVVLYVNPKTLMSLLSLNKNLRNEFLNLIKLNPYLIENLEFKLFGWEYKKPSKELKNIIVRGSFDECYPDNDYINLKHITLINSCTKVLNKFINLETIILKNMHINSKTFNSSIKVKYIHIINTDEYIYNEYTKDIFKNCINLETSIITDEYYNI